MNAQLLALALLLAQQATPKVAGPSPEEVARTVASVETALRSGDPKEVRAALESAQPVPHPDVVRAVARALDESDPELVIAGLQSLRWIDHPAALTALHRVAAEGEKRRSPEIALPLFKAIGQHSDPSSIEVLARNPLEIRDSKVVQARILGLGRIRTKASVEELMGMLAMSDPRSPSGARAFHAWMEDLRLSLIVLTGVDQGKAPELWERWWRSSRRTFEVAPEPPPIPGETRDRWNGYWGLGREYGRPPRREDRGS